MKDKKKSTVRTEQEMEFYPETKRPLVRPEINFLKALLVLFAVFAINCVISYGIMHLLSHFVWYNKIKMNFGSQFVFILAIVCLISILLFSKRIVIFAIRIYQRYAPYDIRSSCLFVPNCSEYMVLAIEKYGLIIGIKKGVDRYKRCHAPNGGEDYP